MGKSNERLAGMVVGSFGVEMATGWAAKKNLATVNAGGRD